MVERFARIRGAVLAGVLAAGLGTLASVPVGCSAGKKIQKPAPAPAAKGIEPMIPETEQVGWLTIRLENPPPASIMAVKPEHLPDYIHSLYRIRPDRRFLYAAAELQRFVTGVPRHGELAIRYGSGRWRLSLDGSLIGDLPEFPSFADAKALLLAEFAAQPGVKNWSFQKRKKTASPLSATDRAALENGTPREVVPILEALNSKWAKSPGDPGAASDGIRGLLWLSLQSFDQLELTDPILGKALALIAIAESEEPGGLAREEALLAALLGYEDHAKLAAHPLPPDDPVRLFAEWDVPGLAALAHRPHADPRAEYLYLFRRAWDRGDETAWMKEFEASSWGQRVNGPSLGLALAMSPFEWRTVPATLMELRVLADATSAPNRGERADALPRNGSWTEMVMRKMAHLDESEPKPPEGRLAELEDAVAREASRANGPILDAQVLRALRLSNFYSAVHAQARYNFDAYGSTDEAEKYANALTKPPAGTASELKDWMLHRVHLRRSADGLREVISDLARLRHIGIVPLNRIVYSVAISSNGGNETIKRRPLPGLFSRFDSRPSSLDAAARAASQLLDDIWIKEQCLRPAVRMAPREVGSDLPWALRFLGDKEGLRAMAADKSWPPSSRSDALSDLALLEKTDTKEIVARFRELIREDPKTNGPLFGAVGALEKQDRIEEALRLVDEWMQAHETQDLTWAAVGSLKSRLLRKRGRFKEAWEAARPAAETWKEDCLQEGVLALIDLKRLDDALEMAKGSLDRYGDASDVILVARVLWLKGKDDEAARIINAPERRLDPNVWSSDLPETFAAALQKADEARALAVFSKLAVPGVPMTNIIWFVEYLTGHGRAPLALKICEGMRGRGPAGWVTVAMYHALRQTRGPAAARDWIRANCNPAELDVFSKQALVDRDFDLAWDLPDHPDATKNEILYLIRAVCLLYQPDVDDRRARLIAFFKSRPQKDFVVYAEYFLGQIDRPTLFAQIKNPEYVCSIGWILGVTCAHEGRYDEANEWLQVALQANSNVPPRAWVTAILGRWAHANCVLSEVAPQKIY